MIANSHHKLFLSVTSPRHPTVRLKQFAKLGLDLGTDEIGDGGRLTARKVTDREGGQVTGDGRTSIWWFHIQGGSAKNGSLRFHLRWAKPKD